MIVQALFTPALHTRLKQQQQQWAQVALKALLIPASLTLLKVQRHRQQQAPLPSALNTYQKNQQLQQLQQALAVMQILLFPPLAIR